MNKRLSTPEIEELVALAKRDGCQPGFLPGQASPQRIRNAAKRLGLRVTIRANGKGYDVRKLDAVATESNGNRAELPEEQ